MEEKKKYFMDCNLAGRKYNEAERGKIVINH
jgi:hypothetical protein